MAENTINPIRPLLGNTLASNSTIGIPSTPMPQYRGVDLSSGDEMVNVSDDFLPPRAKSADNGLSKTVTTEQLYGGRRFDFFEPTKGENEFAYGQSTMDKAVNGTLKGLNLAATTIAGGFGVVAGTAKWILPGGKLSDIWDNPIMNGLDKYNNEVDNYILPNYYTDAEKNAAWYSTENWLTSNFLFDKLIKNSGFAVGAMVSGNIANGLFGAAGSFIGGAAMRGSLLAESSQAFKLFTPLLRNTARAFSSAKNIEAAAILEKEISSIAELTSTSSELANIAKVTNQFAKINDYSKRAAIAAYSSAGESAFEALQTSNEYRNNLIEKYKKENFGEEPTGDILEKINIEAQNVGKVSFLGNMALLSITENAQLNKLLGSTYSAEKQAANSLLGVAEDVVKKEGKYIAKETATKAGKIYDKVTGVGKYVFDPKEMGQEIGQYALQVGTQNYFNKSRETKNADALVDGFLYGMFGETKEGEKVGALVSKEGLESGLLGGITGGLMQARGTYKEGKELTTNTEKFINTLNDAPSFQEAFKDRLSSANRGIVLQEQQQQATISGNKLEAKDINTDMMHNYLAPRIKYGRMDMVMDDIATLKSNGSTEEGLASLKEQGIASINDTVDSYQKRLNRFEQVAKNTEQIYKATDLRYSGEVLKDEEGNAILSSDGKQIRKYSPLVIDKMVYAASKIADYDLRIPTANQSLALAGIDTSNILQSIISNNKPNREATDAALKQINDMDVISDVKDNLKTALSDTIELSLRRKVFMQEYDDIKRKPLNYEVNPEFAFGASEELDVKVEQQELQKDRRRKPTKTEKELKVNKEYSLKEPLRKDGTTLQLAPKITVLSQTLGGEFEVRLPNGQVKFLTPTEFKEYNISDEDNTSKEMEEIFDKAIDTVLDKEEYLNYNIELNTARPEDILDKRAFINDLDDQKLIDDIEKEFNKQAGDLIEKKEKIVKQQKRLVQNKEQIKKQQTAISKKSGKVATPDTSNLIMEEPPLKAASILFPSTITESETWADTSKSKPHVTRSRAFLNKVKKFNPKNGKIRAILVTAKMEKELGLEGLAALSYGTKSMSDVNNSQKGFLASVFVIIDKTGTYFVDENGNKLSKVREQVDLDKVIFQTMPTTSLTNSKGKPRHRAKEKAEAEAQAKGWGIFREKYFTLDGSKTPTPMSFLISRGLAKINPGAKERNQVGGVLIDENKIATQEGLIVIPTTGVVSHNNEAINFPNGVPVLQYADTLEFLNNRKFTDKEAVTIFQVIKALANEVLNQSDNNQAIEFNREYTTFLQNVLYWKLGVTESDNQIRINEETLSLELGKKSYPFADIANSERDIIEQISNAFISVNNNTLTNNFSDAFTEFTFVKNKLVANEWTNYQSYLLASTNPDGSKRSAEETPLVTSVAKPSESVPFTHIAKYATLQGIEFPVEEVKKKSITPSTPPSTSGKFELNGETPNTYDIPGFGQVTFTAKPGEDPQFDETSQEFIDVRTKIIEASNAARKKAGQPNATKEELIPQVNAYIVSAVKKAIDAQNAPEVEAYSFDGKTPNTFDIPNFGTVTFTVSKGEDPKFDEDAEFKKVQQRFIDAINKTKPGTAKAEVLAMANGAIVALVNKEIGNIVTETPNTDIEEIKKLIGEEDNDTLIDWEEVTEFNQEGDTFKEGEKITVEDILFNLKKGLKEAETKLQTVLGSEDRKFYNARKTKFTNLINQIEGKPEVKPEVKPVAKPKPGSSIKPSDDFRLVGLDDKDVMTEEEIQLFKEWMAENLPFIPYEILEQIITTNTGEKAWGVFENNIAKFVRGGLKGTEYHEVFEAIWASMLNESERENLLNEFRNKQGQFTDRQSGKSYDYSDPSVTDKMVKERIADDFSDFRLGKLPARSIGERIQRLFKAILDFFNSFINTPSLKEKLFEDINSGKFKERTLNDSTVSNLAEYRAVEGLSEQQTNNVVQDMTARAAGILFSEANLDLLYSPNRITSQEMFSRIEEKYNSEGRLALMSDVAWKELKEKTKLKLRTLGIGFDTNDKVSINDEESNKNDYAPEPFSVDWKKNSTGPVKFTLATLFETVANNQEDSLVLEFPKASLSESIIQGVKVEGYKLLNFSRAFATVLDKLSNTSNITKAVDKLAGLAEYDANYVRLFGRVSKQNNPKEGVSRTIPFKDFNNNDWRFFIQFMQTFTKQKPEALIQYVSAEATYTGPANLYTAIKATQNNWIENIKTLAATPGNLVTKVGNVYQIKSFKGRIDQDQAGRWRAISPYGDITYHKTEKEAIDEAKDLSIKIKSGKDQVKFLSEIGIEFPYDVYTRLKGSQKNVFVQQVTSIYSYFGENNDLMSLSGKTLKINGPLSKLAELLNKVTNPNQDSTYLGVEGQKIGAFAENNAPSLFENMFNEVDTLDELLEARPELNDLYSKGSQVLKKGGLFFDKEGNRIKTMKVSYIQGTKLTDDNKGITTSNLTLGSRFTQEINQNLDGNYYIIIPADGSTEWMMNLGNNIELKTINSTKSWTQIYSTFKGYLSDDVALALDYKNREKLNNVGSGQRIEELQKEFDILYDKKDKTVADKKRQDDISEEIFDLVNRPKQLRFFKDILFDEQLDRINEMIEENQSQEEIEKYIASESKDINKAIEDFIKSTVKETKTTLLENNEITSYTKKDIVTYSYDNLDATALNKSLGKNTLNNNKLSENNLNDILTYVNVNYIINNFEYHKVLFGDPFQFAIKKDGSLDEPKRIKSFLSPRRTTFDTAEYNTFLNDEMNNVNGIELKPGDPGYHQYKSYTNTITVKDVTVAGSLSNILKAYSKNNEADAMSWLMDNTYKEVKLKNGQWSDEAEAFHQWQMAFTRQNLPGYKYSSTELEKQDRELISKPSSKHTLEVLKPIVTGNKYNKDQFDIVLDKFSQMPIYYSMVKGTNLESLYTQMFNQGIGYAIMESGRKVGAEEIHSLYNGDGSFNTEAFNNKIQIPWKAYGIQVETATEGEKTQTRGSQLTKIASMDLFNNGVASSVKAQQEYERNTTLLNLMHENAYNELLSSLGITEEDGEYTMKDGKSVSETLMHEMTRRELSDNAIDTIALNEENQFLIPFEASPSYVQIRSIIYSMINKSFISPKMSGGAHVQVPSTMFEKASLGRSLMMKNKKGVWEQISKDKFNTLSEEQKSQVLLGDDTLKFYEDEDGKRYCEIMVPHWFKNKFGKMTDEQIIKYLDTEEGNKILSGIGFRIPTQSLSSIEVFKVKGFLPQYMGATVVVPSEITTKAGSDFDIDKLNMYLKSTYKDANGNIRLVTYKGSEQQTKDFYAQVFEDTIQKDIDRITKYDEFRDKLKDIFTIIEQASEQKLEDLSDLMTNDQIDFYNYHSTLLQEIINQASEEGLSPSTYMLNQIQTVTDKTGELNAKALSSTMKDKFVKEMYKKSLENEYYDSLEKLLTLPENFSRLIAPVEDAGLKDLAKYLDGLQGYNEAGVKNKLIDRNYLTNLRHSFVIAKKWVGVAAVNITNLSLKQKSKIYIDPSRFQNIDEADRKFLGDGNILLDHNTVTIDDVEYISLSGTTVKNSDELISSRYSGYATAFVDVAKDPFIMKIIKSDLVIGIFMFLENIGVGQQSAFFLNQPIIQEYLKMLDSKSERWLFKSGNISSIKGKFPTTEELLNTVGIDKTNFEKNITDYYTPNNELSEARNAEQQLILNEFLKYAKMAEFAFKFTQATNYDTTRFGSGDEFSRKQWRTAQALTENIISSVQKTMDNTFIGVQESFLSKSMEAMGSIFKLEERQFRVITDSVLKSFGVNSFIGADTFNKIALQVKSSFLDYIIQTKTSLNKQIEELLVDESLSVASRLEQAKKDYPNLEIIRDLQVVSSDRVNGAKSIKLNVNTKDAYDENLYTGMMREMRDYDENLKSLYNDIVHLSMLQGTYQSAISIKNIIPIEDYSRIVEPIITPLVADGDLEAFTQGMFQRNNFKNKDVFPQFQPPFYETDNEPIIDQYFNEIYTYTSPAFMKIESLDVMPNHRKVMLLDVEKDGFSIKNDFLSVPRVIRNKWNGDIDFITGRTILPSDYAIRKAKGDMSLKDIFGYQKVRLDSGQPLVYYKKVIKNGIVTYREQHVYKLINLYGEGQLAVEHYPDFKKSVLKNGTRPIDTEIPNADLIDYFGSKNPVEEDIFTELPTEIVSIQDKPSIFDLRNVILDYTEGQRVALNDVASMIDSNKQNYYLLAGYAGTGKTTLAENIAKYAQASGRTVSILAPTNKAAKVLNDKLKSTGANANAQTIHKAIYGEPNEFGEWEPTTPLKNSVIIVDESSMIDKTVMNDLLNNTRSNNIVIFMGDGFQLEQIGQDSKLFSALNNKSTFENEYGVKLYGATQLTEVKRQSLDSDILKVATLQRTDDKAYVPSETTGDFKVAKSKDEFVNDYRESIRNNENSVMVVATNEERIAMNKIARVEKFGPNRQVLEDGEVLIAIANSTDYSNSEIFKASVVREDPTKHTLTFTTPQGKKETFDMYFSYVVGEDGVERKVFHFPSTNRASMYHAQVLSAIKDSDRDLYDSLNNDQDIIFNKKGVAKLSPAIVISTYGYAITGHKSQGSQWDKVFVNQNYNSPNWNGARWFYTAITRAAQQVIVMPTANNTRISPEEINKRIDAIATETTPITENKTIIVEPKGTINVYWAQAESATSTKILSNLAPRKFTYKSVDGITREYGSVEHAYQSNKNSQFDKTTYDAYVAKGGYGVKIAPPLTEEGKLTNLQLMKDLVVKSFIQNPSSEASKKLLQYENFTHNTNELIDKAFLEGLKLAQKELLTIGNQTPVVKTTPTTQDRQIQVEQFKITIKPDGKMFYDNGKEVTDQTTKNKVNVRKELQDGTLRTSIYNKANYFVLLDGRIVGSGKTNLGKESITDPKIKEAILAKAVTYKKQC